MSHLKVLELEFGQTTLISPLASVAISNSRGTPLILAPETFVSEKDPPPSVERATWTLLVVSTATSMLLFESTAIWLAKAFAICVGAEKDAPPSVEPLKKVVIWPALSALQTRSTFPEDVTAILTFPTDVPVGVLDKFAGAEKVAPPSLD
jgi:hypothetical protein